MITFFDERNLINPGENSDPMAGNIIGRNETVTAGSFLSIFAE